MFGTLFKFGADTSQFSKAVMTMPRDVQRARNMINGQVQGMNTAFSALGRRLVALTATFGGMYSAINSFKSALEMGGRLDDLSKTTGASAGELALLEKAFELAGSSASAVGPAIARLSRFMVEASNGGKAQAETMQRLGLTYAQLANLAPTEQMRLLAKSIMALPTPAERSAAAMDIFGRSGSTLIPLFSNFSGELDKAQGYLGSLPRLLDQNAGAMADMEDDLGALGEKLDQFVAGLIVGASNADNFAQSLAKIDAAGAGLTVGNLSRFVATNPLKALQALGNTLLSVGATIANEIAAQVMAAFKGLVNVIVSGDFWSGVGNVVQGALLKAASAFEFAIVDAIAKALEAASRIPVAGKMFEGLGEAARQEANKAADAYRAASEQMRQGMSQAGGAFMDAGRGVYNRQDLFGEALYAGRAVQNYAEAMQAASEQSAKASDSEKSFADSVREANAELSKRNALVQGKNPLQAEFEQVKAQRLIDLSTPFSSMTPQEQQRRQQNSARFHQLQTLMPYMQGGGETFGRMTREASMTESERQQAAESARSAATPDATISDRATETTLQKVAKFLEELNTKLPQPVLV